MIINMNGAKAPETPSSVLQEKTVTPETLPTVIGPDEGYDGLSQVTVNPDSQLRAENIRSGKTIFGVAGAFTGEVSYVDELDITKLSRPENLFPIFVPVIGAFEKRDGDTSPRWYGVPVTLTKDNKPSMGAPSFNWGQIYGFKYGDGNKNYIISGVTGMGDLSSYVGNQYYAPVEIDIPEGDYLGVLLHVTMNNNFSWSGTCRIVNTAMSYGYMTSTDNPISATPTSALYATNDAFEIPEQTITVTRGTGLVHLPAIHTTGYVQSYSGGNAYALVSINIYGIMELTIS